MAVNKKGIVDSGKTDFWIKVIPISLTAIGLFFGIYKGCERQPTVNVLEQESWKKTREVYLSLIDLVGNISIAKNTSSGLLPDSLYNEFNKYKRVKLKAVNESQRVNDQMTVLSGEIEDAREGLQDIYNPNSLEHACQRLADSVKVSINEGDIKYGVPK